MNFILSLFSTLCSIGLAAAGAAALWHVLRETHRGWWFMLVPAAGLVLVIGIATAAFSLGALRRSIRRSGDREVLEPAANHPRLGRIERVSFSSSAAS